MCSWGPCIALLFAGGSASIWCPPRLSAASSVKQGETSILTSILRLVAWKGELPARHTRFLRVLRWQIDGVSWDSILAYAWHCCLERSLSATCRESLKKSSSFGRREPCSTFSETAEHWQLLLLQKTGIRFGVKGSGSFFWSPHEFPPWKPGANNRDPPWRAGGHLLEACGDPPLEVPSSGAGGRAEPAPLCMATGAQASSCTRS